jgi:putative tryptophan/tyrosine transport system substrate-binding protein
MHSKKIVGLVAILMMIAVTVAFGAGGAEAEAPESNVIGISKIVAHPALDAVENAIMDELAEQGYTDLEFDLQNAQGDVTTASQIAAKFRSDRVRLAVGIATPTAQALVNSLTDIPVVFAAITDPVAAGLVSSYDGGGENVTGSSDMIPVRTHFEMMQELLGAETVGHVYASGEANAVTLAEMAREAARELGINFVESTVVDSSEVRSATQAIIGRVDAIWVSTDNTVVSALSALTDVAAGAGVPVIAADPISSRDDDVLFALGFDYYKMGRATGRAIVDILEGADPGAMPTIFMTDASDLDLLVNLDVADALGVTFPNSMLADASMIVENGQLR